MEEIDDIHNEDEVAPNQDYWVGSVCSRAFGGL